MTRVTELKVNAQQCDTIEYKYDLSEPVKAIVVLRCAARNTFRFSREFDLKEAYDGSLPVSYYKYKDLQDMCKSNLIPEKYHNFYMELAHIERF